MQKLTTSDIVKFAKEYAFGNNFVCWKSIGKKYGIPDKIIRDSVYDAIEDGTIDLKLAEKVRAKAIYDARNRDYHSLKKTEELYDRIFENRRINAEEAEDSLKKQALEASESISTNPHKVFSKNLDELTSELLYWQDLLENYDKIISESDEFHESIESISLKIDDLTKQISEKRKLVVS